MNVVNESPSLIDSVSLSPEERARMANLLGELEAFIHDNFSSFVLDSDAQKAEKVCALGQMNSHLLQIASLLRANPGSYKPDIMNSVVVLRALTDYLVRISEGTLSASDINNIIFTVSKDSTNNLIAQLPNEVPPVQ